MTEHANVAPPVALGLMGLRSYVRMCCLIVMMSLAIQIVVWALVTFTDVRFKVVEPSVSSTAIVQPIAAGGVRPMGQIATSLPPDIQNAIKPGPIRVRSGFDHLFSDLSTISVAAGSLALIVVMLLLALGVNLMTAQAMTGVDRAISALIWAIIVTVVALPSADLLQLPWAGTALRPYSAIVQQVESSQGQTGFRFYAACFFLPTLCLLGMVVIESRFRQAVTRNLPGLLHPYLDPSIEEEAGATNASSLHGASRNSGALDRIVAATRQRELAEAAAAQATQIPSGQAPSKSEENCRRLI